MGSNYQFPVDLPMLNFLWICIGLNVHGEEIWGNVHWVRNLEGKSSAKNWKSSIVSNKSPMSAALRLFEDSVSSPACSQSPKLVNRNQPDSKTSPANLCIPV